MRPKHFAIKNEKNQLDDTRFPTAKFVHGVCGDVHVELVRYEGVPCLPNDLS